MVGQQEERGAWEASALGLHAGPVLACSSHLPCEVLCF